jgi:hypothetical protein
MDTRCSEEGPIWIHFIARMVPLDPHFELVRALWVHVLVQKGPLNPLFSEEGSFWIHVIARKSPLDPHLSQKGLSGSAFEPGRSLRIHILARKNL